EDIADAGHDIIDFSDTTTLPVELNLSILGTPQTVNANLTLTINGEGVEEVIGGALDDTLRGNSNDNTLRGGPGNDLLDGKSGDDVLDGGAGNDDLNGGADTDTINETEDTDFILTDTSLTRASGEVDVLDNLEVANLTGGPSANRFDISGWTGTGSIDGGDGSTPRLDDLVAAADADFNLTDGSLTISTNLGPITLASIDRVTLTGGPSANNINASGFSGLTVLTGNDGNDTIIGGSGMDIISGGLGDDILTGNAGNDILDGGAGTDALNETRDAYLFRATPAALVIDMTASPGDEEIDLLTGIEDVSLTGGAGSNLFDVTDWTSGQIQVDGQGATDALAARGDGQIVLTDSSITFSGSSGTIQLASIEVAVVSGGDGDDVLDASAFTHSAILRGNGGNDLLISGAGNDLLDGGAGDDVFQFAEHGSFDADSLRGGDGADTLDFSSFASPVQVDLAIVGAPQTVVPGELDLLLFAEDIENIVGGAGADTMNGNTLDNTFTGGPGADAIDGRGGSNTIDETADADFTLTDVSLTIAGVTDTLTSIHTARLTGGPSDNLLDASAFSGDTILNGAEGNDKLVGGSGPDFLIGGPGNDTLAGGDGDDWYRFDADEALGADIIDDASGSDVIDFSLTETVGVTIDLGLTSPQTVVPGRLILTLTAGDAIEALLGGAGADQLVGNALDNLFSGGQGDDLINGVAGSNTLFEQRDADLVLGDTSLHISGDLLNRFDPLNERDLDAAPAIPGTENDTLLNVQQAILSGGDGNNTLDASAFTLGSVALVGGKGYDVLIGGSGDDQLLGGEGNDQLYGNAGNDNLQGGAGDDQLTGGGGNDQLRGNAGNDTYRFDKSFDQGTDELTELVGEGYADTILGLGLAGVDIDLFDGSAQQFYDDQSNLVLTLTLTFGAFGTVEYAY
ncbi:MAG: calcium-binding protein, partial [Verrucomicrobia bacterium]